MSPMMRVLGETSYQFSQPFVMDASKYAATFGATTTPLPTAVSETVAWYRSRGAAPSPLVTAVARTRRAG